jgi:hypothetical protein
MLLKPPSSKAALLFRIKQLQFIDENLRLTLVVQLKELQCLQPLPLIGGALYPGRLVVIFFWNQPMYMYHALHDRNRNRYSIFKNSKEIHKWVENRSTAGGDSFHRLLSNN